MYNYRYIRNKGHFLHYAYSALFLTTLQIIFCSNSEREYLPIILEENNATYVNLSKIKHKTCRPLIFKIDKWFLRWFMWLGR